LSAEDLPFNVEQPQPIPKYSTISARSATLASLTESTHALTIMTGSRCSSV
jgi:hypothetical protein